MTSQGTAHGRFQWAIRDHHLRRAEMAAREIGELSLADALKFCLLLADADPTLRPSDSEMASLASLHAVRLDRNHCRYSCTALLRGVSRQPGRPRSLALSRGSIGWRSSTRTD